MTVLMMGKGVPDPPRPPVWRVVIELPTGQRESYQVQAQSADEAITKAKAQMWGTVPNKVAAHHRVLSCRRIS